MASFNQFSMSKEDQQKLRSLRVKLIEDLYVDEQLLSAMIPEVLTDSMKEDIEVKDTRASKVGALLDLLPKRGPDAFKVFVGALEQAHKHLANALKKPLQNIRDRPLQQDTTDAAQDGSETSEQHGPPYEMSKEHKDKLRRNRVYLVENIVISESLFSYLLQSDTLTCHMKEKIESKKTPQKITGDLLDLLPRRGPSTYKHFIKALIKTEQGHIAGMLEGSNVDNILEAPTVDGPHMPIEETAKDVVDQGLDSDEPLMNLSVKPVDINSNEFKKRLCDKKNVYKMSSKPCGRALIINNYRFTSTSGLKERNGGTFDSSNLKKLFSDLSFKVGLYCNQTAEQIHKIIKEEQVNPLHKDSDCFVLFVLSHGKENVVRGTDDKAVLINQDLLRPFHACNCPDLRGKPKLFFIQACRKDDPLSTHMETLNLEETNQPNTSNTSNNPLDADSQPNTSNTSNNPLDADIQLSTSNTSNNLSEADSQPNTSNTSNNPLDADDIFTSYSTVLGHKAWRDPLKGSFYVRAIVKQFSKHAHVDDFRELIRKVSQQMQKYGGVPQNSTTTTKQLYFFPGNHQHDQ